MSDLRLKLLSAIKAYTASKRTAHNAYVRYARPEASRKDRSQAIQRYIDQEKMAQEHMRSVMRLAEDVKERKPPSDHKIECIVQAVARESGRAMFDKIIRDAIRKVLRDTAF